MTVKSMEDPLEVLAFAEQHADLNARTLEASLRVLGKCATGKNYNSIVQDERFHSILSSLAGRLEDCDARTVSMIAEAAARFRTSTPELNDFAQKVAEVFVRREGSFTPRNLVVVALSLSVRGVRDTTTVEFVKAEALKQMADFEPSHCSTLLEAFRRWGIFDRELVDQLVERMSDEVDRFTSRDVVDTLAVASKLGLARGFLLRRLCGLTFENLRQFNPRELAMITYSLSKLRFLAHSDLDDVLDVLSPDFPQLTNSQVSSVLFALAMTDARHQADAARSLVGLFTDPARPNRTLPSLIDAAWSLCALDLVNEFEQDFKGIMKDVFDRPTPQNRIPLMKLFDVICALELHHKGLAVPVPQAWRAACDDAERYEMEKLESSRLHNEVVMRLDHLKGQAQGTRWQLRMQRNQPAGPYRVDMLDEDTKVVIDIEIISWPTARAMKHRLLRDLGFKPVRLEYWEWRRARTEEDQNKFLQDVITQALEAAEA